MSALSLRAPLVVVMASLAMIAQSSCARSSNEEPSFGGPSFSTGGTVPSDVCISTECPYPRATCPGARGVCTVDLRSDVDHCGGCETRCRGASFATHSTYLCADAQCVLVCTGEFANCNGDAADGCETPTTSDPANCGACGTSCKEGDICWKGACGCPSGFTQCGDDCVQLDSDPLNCGACDSVCQPPTSPTDSRWLCGPEVTPPNMEFNCVSAACSLQCKGGFGDCNQNKCLDGCEIDLRSDPKNCGACGNTCDPGQSCREGQCLCPAGLTECRGECVNLAADPWNCGRCGVSCRGREGATGSPSCEAGECKYVCFPGYADCDQDIDNGCEANLRTSQRHCGSCGTACDIAGGQPCIDGVCPTKPCEAVTTK